MIHNGQGFTIVDSLDTILLMGLDKEFEEAKAWVKHELNFDQDGEVNLFETTIRVLGGLLSAYDQSGHDSIFLTKAVDLADRLMGAFKTDSGIPFASVHLRDGRGVPGHEGGISSTSEVATLQLEFKYLSYLSGDDKYWRAAEDVVLKIKELPSVDGLVPIFINPYNGQFHGSEIRLGSRGDSYYGKFGDICLSIWIWLDMKAANLITNFNIRVGGSRILDQAVSSDLQAGAGIQGDVRPRHCWCEETPTRENHS